MSHERIHLAWALVALVAAPAAWPAAADPAAAILACRQEADDAKRLACYDRESGRLDADAVAKPAPAVDTRTPEERFGKPAFEREELVKREQASRGLEQLTARVTAVTQRADGTLAMTLENGQVWAQKRPESRFRVKAGDQIKIEPASMGSFLMSNSDKRSTRVTRLK